MEQNEKGFTGVWIPAHITEGYDLTVYEMVIWSYIASFNGAKLKCCIQSNETIAERFNISSPTVSRAIKSLKDKGLIFVHFVNGNSAKRQLFTVDQDPKKTAFITKAMKEQTKQAILAKSEPSSKPKTEKTVNIPSETEKSLKTHENKSADTSWVDDVEKRIQKSEVKAPEGYVIVDPKDDDYNADTLFGSDNDADLKKKRSQASSMVRNSSWYKSSH